MSVRVHAQTPTAEGIRSEDGTRVAASSMIDEHVRTGDEYPGLPSDPRPLPPLLSGRTFHGTVWIPRILWALEWGRREGRPRLSAADIARVLTQHCELDVPRHNVARAFRDYRNDTKVARLWKCSGRGYEITDAGARTLEALLLDDASS